MVGKYKEPTLRQALKKGKKLGMHFKGKGKGVKFQKRKK